METNEKARVDAIDAAQQIAERLAKTGSKAPSDSDIVSGLRSSDPAVRSAALSALFPWPDSALLVRTGSLSMDVSTSKQVDAQRLFAPALYAAQQIGNALGLSLKWVSNPAPEETSKGIQIVRG